MFGLLEPYCDWSGTTPDGLTGLVVHAPLGIGRMQVTVGSVVGVAPPGGGGLAAEGVGIEYDLDGELAFEIATLAGKAGTDGPHAVWTTRHMLRDELAVLDAIPLWHEHRDTLRAAPPPPAPERRKTLLTRQIAARRSAAQTPRARHAVDPSMVPQQQRAMLAEHLAQIDDEQLCFHFPRDQGGRYLKSAVVALAGYEAGIVKRGPWLAVRAEGGTLVVGVEALIGENQDHRWDNSPWLWNTAHRHADAQQRWQLSHAEHARPIVDMLDRNAPINAFTL